MSKSPEELQDEIAKYITGVRWLNGGATKSEVRAVVAVIYESGRAALKAELLEKLPELYTLDGSEMITTGTWVTGYNSCAKEVEKLITNL